MIQQHSETMLHMAAVDYLKGELWKGMKLTRVQRPFDCIFLHPVNEFKDEKEAYWAKRKGILPGAADLLFWWKPYVDVNAGAIELKTRTGLTPSQFKFKEDFIAMGGNWAVCKTVTEVRDTLIAWGLPCKNMHCIEPPLTQAQKIQMSMAFQAPHIEEMPV